MFPNAYYNYLKDRKAGYRQNKSKILTCITETYHERKGIPGYRLMTVLLKNKGISISKTTCHKYMNTELGLFSVTRRHKPDYRKGCPFGQLRRAITLIFSKVVLLGGLKTALLGTH